MKKICIVLFVCFITTYSVSAQYQRGNRNRNIGNVSQNQEPTDAQIKKQKEEAIERRNEYITKFLSTLEADEFQKEIAKQTLVDFYEKTQEFVKQSFENNLKRKDAFDAFKENHFKELKTLISEDDSAKLDEFLEGKFKERDAKKKKRKKRRNKDRK